MTTGLLLLVLVVSFIVLILWGVPLGFSLFCSSLLTIALDPDLDLVVIPLRMYAGINNFVLLAIPGFMFAAFLMNRIGITEDIVSVSDVFVGYIRGGMAHINIVASMLFAGVSGSSTADTAGIGAILIPPMTRQGYDKGFSAAVTAASSTIGNIIPPSIFMVVYGAVAGTSIGGLFLAGIIPGILVGLSQIGVSYYFAVKDNYGAKRAFPSFTEILLALRRGIWPVLLIVIIIGGIVGGIYTATEAAAISVLYVVFIGAVIRRSLTWKMLVEAAQETVNMTAVVLFCVATATLFAWLMSFYDALDPLTYFFTHYSNHPALFLLYVIVIFIFLGTFMDPVPAMVILVPILVPISNSMNIHPLLLGILVVMSLCVGKITPPYGISLLLACAIAEVQLGKAMKYTLIFFGAFCLVMLAIVFFPEISLSIPRYFMPELFAH